MNFIFATDGDLIKGSIKDEGFTYDHTTTSNGDCEMIELSVFDNKKEIGHMTATLIEQDLTECLEEIVSRFDYYEPSQQHEGNTLIIDPSYVEPQYRGHHIMKQFVGMVKELMGVEIGRIMFANFSIADNPQKMADDAEFGKGYSDIFLLRTALRESTPAPKKLKDYFASIAAA